MAVKEPTEENTTKTKTFKTRIKQRRDTSANWESKNPVLLNGEVIIVDTANGETRTKTGDGTKSYTQLPFDDEGTKGGKSLIDKSFADNVSTNGNTATIDKQLKTYSITTRLEADVAITGLDENGQEVIKHKLSEKANTSYVDDKVSGKVDKVDGKSLIDETVASNIRFKDATGPDSSGNNYCPAFVGMNYLGVGNTTGVEGAVFTEEYTYIDNDGISFLTVEKDMSNPSAVPTVTKSETQFTPNGVKMGAEGTISIENKSAGENVEVTSNSVKVDGHIILDGSGVRDSFSDNDRGKSWYINSNGIVYYGVDSDGSAVEHSLAKKANTSDLAKKVGTGDNYNPNTSAANVINLSGLTKEQYDSGEYTEGSNVAERTSGIKFDTGTATKKAQITIGSDSSGYNTVICSRDSIVGTQNGYEIFGISANNIWCGDTTYSTMPGEVHYLKKKWEGKTYTISVPITDWVEKTDSENQKYYYKKITVSNMTEYGQAMTDVAMSDNVATARKQMEAYQCINRVVTGEGYVELYCFDEAPTTAFTLRVLVIGAWLG